MRASLQRAERHGVAVGAHPSFVDRAGFGRVALEVEPALLREQVRRQLGDLVEAGGVLRYVKPHGALYHSVSADRALADAVAAAIADVSDTLGRALPVLGLDGAIVAAAEGAGLPFLREAFLDRGYLADGRLVPRSHPGALLHEAAEVADRAVRLATEGVVEAIDGTLVEARAVSLCVHGDSPGAVAMARAVRAALDDAGVAVRPPW